MWRSPLLKCDWMKFKTNTDKMEQDEFKENESKCLLHMTTAEQCYAQSEHRSLHRIDYSRYLPEI